MADDSTRTMRDAFSVWNLDRVEQEVVLWSSDDQYVAVPIPEGKTELFEELASSEGTVDATLVRSDEGEAAWQVKEIYEVDEVEDGK